MPLFVVIGHDVEDSAAKRLEARPAHVARLKTLHANGQLVLAGPCPQSHEGEGAAQMSGSVIVVDFSSQQALEDWLKDEPYLHAGVYSHVDVKPFIQALPSPV